MKKTLKVDLNNSKLDRHIPAGTVVDVTFPKEKHGKILRMTAPDGTTIAGRTFNVDRYFGMKTPSLKTLEKWSDEGIAKSVGGKKVEPDGWDSNGTPSWLLVFGII